MKTLLTLIFLLSLALLWPRSAHAQEPVILTDEQDSYLLGLHVATLHDPNDELTLAQVMSPEYAAKFVPSQEETPTIGFNTTGWARLQINNQSLQTWRLVYNFSNIQIVDYYLFDSNQTLLEQVVTGSARPFAQRQLPNHRFVFTPPFQPNETYTIYLHLQGRNFVPVPLTLKTVDAWGVMNGWQNLGFGLFLGALLVMWGYNFGLFFSLRELNYLYYIAWLGCFTLSQGFTSGFGVYLWGDLGWWNYNGVVLFNVSSAIFTLLFCHSFLAVKSTWPRLSRFIYLHILFLIVGWLPFIFNLTDRFVTVALVGVMLVPVVVFGSSFWAWWQGYRAARYLLGAWIVFGAMLVLNLLSRLGVLAVSNLTEHGALVGLVLMMLLLSLALTDRINLLKSETEQANQNLHESEKQLLHYQHHLEEIVVARTEELNRVNVELDRLAHVDGLTQIANRRRFDQYLAQAWQNMAQAKLPLSLILCDIDYFKLYNDSYGHQRGDDCLRQVAQAFTTAIKRSTDLAARYGGEEFVLVLPRTDEAGVKIVAGYLHERVQQLQIPHAASKCCQYITISLGVTTIIPTLDQSPDDLVTTADAALYQAKLQGRNRTVSQAVGD